MKYLTVIIIKAAPFLKQTNSSEDFNGSGENIQVSVVVLHNSTTQECSNNYFKMLRKQLNKQRHSTEQLLPLLGRFLGEKRCGMVTLVPMTTGWGVSARWKSRNITTTPWNQNTHTLILPFPTPDVPISQTSLALSSPPPSWEYSGT